jgi:3'-phosphoadenosine 5'-phosphosulfate sulfotransferase (PAPS reductase)/FAD synthetase
MGGNLCFASRGSSVRVRSGPPLKTLQFGLVSSGSGPESGVPALPSQSPENRASPLVVPGEVGKKWGTKTLRVVSVSGGKDSTALYLWAIEQFGKDGFRAVFADTGHEHPVTLNYVRHLHEMAGGPVVEWVQEDFGPRLAAKGLGGILEKPVGMLALWLWKGRAPSSQAQFCTEHLKLKPIKDWLAINRGLREVEMYVGIRAGESEKRSLMPEEEDSDYYDCIVKRPLLRWSEEAVFAYLKAKGVPPNPLYAGGASRVGCYPCIHSRKSELARMEDWAWERLATGERLSGRTWFSFGEIPLTPDQVLALKKAEEWHEVECPECKGKGYTRLECGPIEEDYDCDECCATGKVRVLTSAASLRIQALKIEFSPTVEQVREWTRTSRGGRQFDMFALEPTVVASCMGTWGACE